MRGVEEAEEVKALLRFALEILKLHEQLLSDVLLRSDAFVELLKQENPERYERYRTLVSGLQDQSSQGLRSKLERIEVRVTAAKRLAKSSEIS